MPPRDFRPTLFSPEERSWKLFSFAAGISCLSLISWLSQVEPEPSAYSSEAWTELPIPMNKPPSPKAEPPNVAFEKPTTQDSPLKVQLLAESKRGSVRSELLLETFFEQEEAHGGSDAGHLMDAFLQRSEFDSTYMNPVEQLANLKAQMMADPDLVYVSRAYTFTEGLLEDEIQCQSSTMLISLAWLQQKTTQWSGGPRPVFVMSPNHVQPGLLYEGALHLMEGTSRGNRVSVLNLAELGNVRILDAKDALTWSLLRDDTPDLIQDRMVLFNTHDGNWHFSSGSGSDSWIHLPHSFGGPIELSSIPKVLKNNTDPASMLEDRPSKQSPSVPEAPESRMWLEAVNDTSTPFSFQHTSLQSGERATPLTCPCREPGHRYPPRDTDPCEGYRLLPNGESCDSHKP